MPSGFGTGITEGFVKGWTQQSEQMDQAKRQEKQQQIENNLHIINAQDLPDDVKQNAAQQLQDLMQGKKPGAKAGGQLSPVLQNLLKMIGKSHGSPSGGMTENMPNGQPAPGTAGSTPGAGFPQGQQPAQPGPQATNAQTGRPTIAPQAAAQPSPSGEPQQNQQPSTLDSQIDATQRALGANQNPITKQKLQNRLNSLNDLKIKQEGEAAKDARAESGRESLETVRAGFRKDLQDLKDQQAKDMEAARLQGKEAVAGQAKKDREELDKYKESMQEKLRAFDVQNPLSKSAGSKSSSTGGGPSAPATEGGWRSSALNELITGDKPTFGLGKSDDRTAYNKARKDLINELGPDGASALRSQYKAGNSGLAGLVKQRDTVGAFERAFEADLGNARSAAEAVPKSQAALFNSWQQLSEAKLTDNTPLSKFKVATQTAINQYARLMFSATGGGTSTDTARKDAEQLLNTAMAKGAYSAAIDQMQLEVKNRTAGLDDEIKRQVSQLSSAAGGKGGAAGPGKSSGGAQPKTAADYLKQIGQQ